MQYFTNSGLLYIKESFLKLSGNLNATSTAETQYIGNLKFKVAQKGAVDIVRAKSTLFDNVSGI